MRSLESILLATALAAASCSGEQQPQRPPPPPPQEDIEVPEGMEGFGHLLGHNTPYASLTDWNGARPEGLTTLWHTNGVKEGEGTYGPHNQKTGAWTFWYRNGQKRWEGTYAADKVVGVERAWFESGSRHYEGAFVDGLREGEWSYWHPNGRPMWKGHFAKGKRHGSYLAWNASGELDSRESGTYEHGVKMSDAPAATVETSLADRGD